MAKRRMGMIAFLLCICFCLMFAHAQAVSTADAAEPISIEQDCDLTLLYRGNGVAFADVPVKLYHVADVSADYQYTLTSAFAASGLELNGIQTQGEWKVIRSTLEAYILANDAAATRTAETDADGQVRFAALQPGLYLASAGRAVQDGLRGSFDSALVALPGLGEDGLWQYAVTVASKSEVTPTFKPEDPSEPEDPPKPDDPDPPTPDGGVQFKILKLWKGDDGRADRPHQIEVELFRDGASVQTVILSEENHWSYHWTAEADGADWMAVERNVPADYTATVEERGTTFVLTNTRITEVPPTGNEPASTDAPKTGDTTNILLYTILMYASGISLILLGITGKRKRA